jgi:REP-associated tyrosine transposase
MRPRYDPDKHHRRSIRLKGYDYSRTGAYFITLCVEQRDCLFGEIIDSAMKLHEPGRMVQRWWDELIKKFPSLTLDEMVIMPNHLHGILFSTGGRRSPSAGKMNLALGDVVEWFKTMTTNEYIRGVKGLGWRCFPGRLWQRDYFERVIRNEEELQAIREYIRQNPAQWASDAENPAVVQKSDPKQGGHIGPPLQATSR